MHTISRRIAAFALAGALFLPTTVGVAHAQSSFGSSSAGNEYTDNNSNTGNTKGSKADRIERGTEEGLKSVGHIVNATAEARAEAVLKQAINNEFPFDTYYNNGVYYHLVSDQNPMSVVIRLTPEQADAEIEALDTDFYPVEAWEARIGDAPKQFGVAVGKNSEFYYIVYTVLED